ncbi:hypothetical protein FG93_05473 [Bosea sp. LC85]|uniref:hypothetical protein n=1 Tax=Bosea sp. LC85 TaxID=1502851 RepID=UPI0004E2A975|nr:hypothetical protein [Bosea sp. LC85]KFC63963.1 hypothetical protein FG93_05473 [Bosea sp. LC85]
MTELTVPAMLLFSLATVLATFAASWGVIRFQGHQNDRRLARLEQRLEQQAIDLAAFKLEAAQRFVTDDMMAKLEERVIGAIDRLADRLDRLIEARVAGRKPTA